jgi:murein DD-endopeptidase MepM/ murein hydrolase activator NlpD
MAGLLYEKYTPQLQDVEISTPDGESRTIQMFKPMMMEVFQNKVNKDLQAAIPEQKYKPLHLDPLYNVDVLSKISLKELSFPNTNVVSSNTKQSKTTETLKNRQTIDYGNIQLTVKDPYGIREDVPGRKGRHSGGIDYTTNTKQAIALYPGTVIKISKQLQSNQTDQQLIPIKGENYDASRASLGWYIHVKHDDGSIGQYAHLDLFEETDINKLLNQKVEVGQVLHSYKRGSGTGTGPHVKFQVLKAGKHTDPSPYIFKALNLN